MYLHMRMLWMVLVIGNMQLGVFGLRFVIDRRECLSQEIEYGATVRFSFVVIKIADRGDWHFTYYGTDLLVKGPNGEEIEEFRDKTSGKSEFVAPNEGVYEFCFSNKSPYQETLDFDVHLYNHVEHAKDDHFNPILKQISTLEDSLDNIEFAQHWIGAETYRHAILNERMSRRAMHKAIVESATLIGASILQVYLLQRQFKRKLAMSRV